MSERLTTCRAITVLLLLCFGALPVYGQVIRVAPMSAALPPEALEALAAAQAAQAEAMPTGPTQEAAPTEATESAEPKSEEEQLVELLLQATFDRSTKAILNQWSESKEVSQSPQKQKVPTNFQATVANAFEGLVVFKLEQKSTLKKDDIVSVKVGEESAGKVRVLSVDGLKVVGQIEKPKLKNPPKAKPKTDKPATKEPPKKSSDDATKPNAENKPADDSGSPDDKNKPNENNANQPNENDATKSEDQASELRETPEPAEATVAKQNEPSLVELKTGEKVVITPAPKAKDQAADIAKSAAEKVKAFERDVTLGNWGQVKQFLTKLKKENADKVYGHLLSKISIVEPEMPEGVPEEIAQQIQSQMQQRGQRPQTGILSPDDILALTEAAPNPIVLTEAKPKDASKAEGDSPKPGPKKVTQTETGKPGGEPGKPSAPKVNHLRSISNLIQKSQASGFDFAKFVDRLREGTTHFGGQDRLKRLTAAELLMQANLTESVDDFLPSLDEESTKTDVTALRIWAKLARTRFNQKRVADWLVKAWEVNQMIVAAPNVGDADKNTALTNLIELSPQVDKDLGQNWLSASFTEAPERGMKILTNLGTKASRYANQASMVSQTQRLKLLRLQNQAAEKLIELNSDSAQDWEQALTLLAQNWIKEANTSVTYSRERSRNSYMQIDMYGNYYWVDENQRMGRSGGRQPRPIKIGDVLEIAPSEQWQKIVDPGLMTEFREVFARLHLRINEEDKAFPFIENLAPTHPELATELVHEFLDTWTRNHDPNTDRQQRNPYIYFYGFDQKAEAIPLTRSKQQRNLAELTKWVEKIRSLPLEDIDESKLANAFTTCHSSAEVFRMEAVKNVFGDLEDLKPETIANLCQKMRANLVSNWREVRTQEQKQTKRKEPEVQQEVLRGYEVAKRIAKNALKSSPDNWELHLALACLMYDENSYSQTVQKSSEFSDRRDQAFVQFEKAAQKYQSVVRILEQKDQSTSVYDYWFYASLGACDLGKITDKTIPDLRQYKKIRDAITGLPGSLAEEHMAKFANNLFTRMSPIKPEIKFRYLRGGFEIVQDHPRAWEAKNLYNYYKDLVSEIKLQVEIDGDDNVGHSEPFGVYVNILHTTEIERESGGFAKYVQNQNNMPFAYNYGRPTEDYRDKFSDAASQVLEEHFEILNITFQKGEEMKSRPAAKQGWRVTPYAYMLLKPRGSEVDRISPLKLDLDFLDTSGYVGIPIESPAKVIDASQETGSPRPIENLQVTQTLDERQAAEGKLIVEISATAKGLVPNLEQIFDVERDNFEVVSIDDQGVLPKTFDPDSNEIQILSDRSWTVEYKAKQQSDQLTSFTFADARNDDTTVKFQRYEDADLVEVEQSVELEKSYAEFSWAFLYWLIPSVIVGLVAVAGLIFASTRPVEVKKQRFEVPDDVNPFTVLTLLKDIKQRNGISNEQAQELETSINRVEAYFFGDRKDEDQVEDLANLADHWVKISK